MSLNAVEKATVIKEYQTKANDTGSPEVQVAVLTSKINKLTEHFKTHKHDNNSRRGLLRMISHRRKLMRYLRKVDVNRFRELVKRLGLRGA